MYLKLFDKLEKRQYIFSGYDSNKTGFCSWTLSPDLARDIPENDCRELVKFLILNGIYDTDRFKFEISNNRSVHGKFPFHKKY